MSAPPNRATETGRAVAVIDVGAVERNCVRIASELDDHVELCAVVKADGYGHGAVECARAALAGGAGRLAVAAASEAVELRSELPEADVFVMGALTPGELDLALDAGAEISVWRSDFLELVRQRAADRAVRPRVHVKYDTGMGRLGERRPDAVRALVDAVAGAEEVELTALWTHFATADEPGSEFLSAQLERFASLAERIRADHSDVLLHAANSAATLVEPSSHFDMVRCGIAIYGLDPFNEDPAGRRLEPALTLNSYVADVKRFEAGASAGYGQSWFASEDTCVGVLPIGYGDGVRRALSNNAEVLVRGRRHPLVGTVSMDNVTIDLGPEPDVEPGDPAVLIGPQGGERILAEEVARRISTINYEVTCGISARVPREYRR
ncbi:MAG TPA: alanine racemase [Solirubrobacterales bacterium]|nr:alanine racemase [Solirubrobacterales bacterium]